MRKPPEQHRARPWRVHDLAPDFDLWDVWEFPITAQPERGDSLAKFWRLFVALEREMSETGLVGFLFKIRKVLGRWFGWDEPHASRSIPGCREHTVRDRLEPTIREEVDEPRLGPVDGEGFNFVYRDESESLHELSNSTVHALLHLGWVEVQPGLFAPQIAVYTKARGLLGKMYLKLIEPFRRLIVYPGMMRAVARAWPRREGILAEHA